MDTRAPDGSDVTRLVELGCAVAGGGLELRCCWVTVGRGFGGGAVSTARGDDVSRGVGDAGFTAVGFEAVRSTGVVVARVGSDGISVAGSAAVGFDSMRFAPLLSTPLAGSRTGGGTLRPTRTAR